MSFEFNPLQEEDTNFDFTPSAEFKESEDNTWGNTLLDSAIQGGLGLAKVFTWPLDVLKLAGIGEGIQAIDEMEEQAFLKGEPFDRNKAIESLGKAVEYFPTQTLAEQGVTKATGIELQPTTNSGKWVRHAAELASLSPGSVIKKAVTGALGATGGPILQQLGVPEPAANLVSDIFVGGAANLKSVPRAFEPETQRLANAADKFKLPLTQGMTSGKSLKGRATVSQDRLQSLQKDLGESSESALKKVIEDSLPMARLKNRGVNLQDFSNYAYDQTAKLSAKNPKQLNMAQVSENISNEINRIRSRSPSPSDQEVATIRLLEKEGEKLTSATPNSQQLINQFQNYNANQKEIYRKPRFTGVENGTRQGYEFLKKEITDAIESQVSPDISNSFKAANKIYSEYQKTLQSEAIIQKAFKYGEYNPKALEKVLTGNQRQFLERNLGKQGIKDIEEIAHFGQQAQNKVLKQLNRSKSFGSEVAKWGKVAPLILMGHTKLGVGAAFIPGLIQRARGYLMTRPATRKQMSSILESVSKGNWNAVKRQFGELEKEISKEFGSVDGFVKDIGSDLPTFEFNE